ncbi:MAG: precorrin-3B C(17)-methyltransferase [Deltaproteobacteria bacterium]|nr:precorrin-3B C(17)-methyltransferase [Deltaproteobacteria bacterium]
MILYVIGTGPGNTAYMSGRAIEILKEVDCVADCVAGYTTYIDLIFDLVKDKEIISTGMMKEVERVEKAIDQALAGRSCALVSGGDPGIYAMAGLVFEICMQRGINLVRTQGKKSQPKIEDGLFLEIVPGIPALAAGAALAGAPLTHDFAAISLSDLLTPWEKIEKRLTCAAMADFVIVLYNPKSKKRTWQLKRAQELILEHRKAMTPVSIVTGAMRENQQVSFTTLDKMNTGDVGMQTVVFIGSSASLRYLDFLFTPRGYSKKYDI